MGGQRGVTRAIERNPLRAMLDEVLGFGRAFFRVGWCHLRMAPTGKLSTSPSTKLNTASSNKICPHRRQAIIEKKPNQSNQNPLNRNQLQRITDTSGARSGNVVSFRVLLPANLS